MIWDEPQEESFVFASFRLLPKQRTLLLQGEPVEIGGRAFDILMVLVERAGAVVTAAELISCVWPNIFVQESNLRVQIGTLRKVLSRCESASRAIETVPLRGYCFILPVSISRTEPSGTGPLPPAPPAIDSLPILLNTPIGRDETMEIIFHALATRRLVTITGPGGIGKTTVAVAVALRCRGRFPGTLTYVDFSALGDASLVVETVAAAIGLQSGEADTMLELCAALHDHPALLVLDTCEHLIEPIALLAETLLARCPNLRLLIASREALRAAGEWTHRLSSLSLPASTDELTVGNAESFAAIKLFIERVRAATRYDLLESDLPLIAEICRRLDGIPLALEFAAARVADLGLRELGAHLDNRFTILTRGRRTALPRHRTLFATLEWSFDVLSSDQQLLLRRLALHSGSFSIDFAVAAAQEEGCSNGSELLSSLYEKSLLSSDSRSPSALFRLLDTTRAFIVEKMRAASKGDGLAAGG